MPRCMQPEHRRYIPPELHRRNHNHNNRVAILPYMTEPNYLPHIFARPRIFERQRFVPSIPAPLPHRMPNSLIPHRPSLITYPTPPVHPDQAIPYYSPSFSRPQDGASSSISNSQRREEPEYITLSSDDEAEAPPKSPELTIMRPITVQEDKPEVLLEDPQPTKPTSPVVEREAPGTENRVSLDGEQVSEDPQMNVVVAIPMIDLTVSAPPSPHPALEHQSRVVELQTPSSTPAVDVNTPVLVIDDTIPAVDVFEPVAQASQPPLQDPPEVMELQNPMPLVDDQILLDDALSLFEVEPLEDQSQVVQIDNPSQEPMEIDIPPTTEPTQSPLPTLQFQAPLSAKRVKLSLPTVQSVTISPNPVDPPVHPYLSMPYHSSNSSGPQHRAKSSNSNSQKREEPEYITLSSDEETEEPSRQSEAKITRTMPVQEDKPQFLLEDPQPTKPTTSAVEPVAPRTDNRLSLDGELIPQDAKMNAAVAIPLVDLTVSAPPSPHSASEDRSRVDLQTPSSIPVVDVNTPVSVPDATVPAVDVLVPVSPSSKSPMEDQSQVVELETQPSMPVGDAATPAVVDPVTALQVSQTVRIPPKPIGIPVRKSKRIHKENERKKNEAVTNFKYVDGGLDRGTTLPIGLLQKSSSKKFTPAGSSQKDETPRIGVDFQAKIDSEVKEWNSEMMEDEDEKDELMWKPLKFETEEGILVDVEQDSEEIEFYKELRNVYWRAIWRQFEGHIPMEIALQHLMKNQYKFSKSLWTIDENLKNLPQVFKPPCMAQVKLFQHLLKDKKKSRRTLQKEAMKNYHLGEIQHFYYQFRRFYKYQEKHPEDCDCFEPLHENLTFEPRYACSHCTESLRHTPIPSDNESVRSERLCLLCQTIQKLTGKRLRSRDIILNEDEELKIEQWNEKERQLKRHVPREEFEEIISNENTEKWKREIVTPEEKSMLNSKELCIPNRKKKGRYTGAEKQKKGQKVSAQLQPFILPLYTKCNCREAGIISIKSPNFKKDDFSRVELDEFAKAIKNYNGNLENAAIELDVELELVRKFSTIYAGICRLLKFFPNNQVPVFEPIEMPPRSNLPPNIPDSSSPQ